MNLLKRIFGKNKKEYIIDIEPIVEPERYYINEYVGEAATNYHTFLGKWHTTKEGAAQEKIELDKNVTYKYFPFKKDILKSKVEQMVYESGLSVDDVLKSIY